MNIIILYIIIYNDIIGVYIIYYISGNIIGDDYRLSQVVDR
jgi:hypothetical protein